MLVLHVASPGKNIEEGVEKVRQRRSRDFVVLTYCVYTPLAKAPAALLDRLF